MTPEIKMAVTVEELRMLMAESKIKNYEVARMLNCSEGHMSALLRGKKNSSPDFMDRTRRAIEFLKEAMEAKEQRILEGIQELQAQPA